MDDFGAALTTHPRVLDVRTARCQPGFIDWDHLVTTLEVGGGPFANRRLPPSPSELLAPSELAAARALAKLTSPEEVSKALEQNRADCPPNLSLPQAYANSDTLTIC